MRPRPVRAVACVAVAMALGAGAAPRARQASSAEIGDTLVRIGAYVEAYYGRAQSIVAQETVIMQPLGNGLSSEGFARRLVYELRVEWDPTARGSDAAATVVRELIKATGPPLGPPDQPDCMDPRGVSPEPLAFLLPDRKEKYKWRAAGSGRVNGRAAMMVEYRPVAPEPPKIVWDRDCAQIDLPGRIGGRVWADPVTAEIMRVDEYLVGMVDIPTSRQKRLRAGMALFHTIERADSSIRYKPVTFANPDETLLLPSQIESVTVIRNSGVPRLRTTQTFSNYRRFVTASRLVF